MANTPVQMLTGTIVDTGTGLGVNVRGSVIAAAWVAGYVPALGDMVRVLVIDSLATILGPVHASARPLSGIVSAAGNGFATVDGISARYMGSAPAAGTRVRLDWATSVPWILGAVTDLPPAPADPVAPTSTPAPPATSDTGVLTVAAGWSGSYRPAPYSKWESDVDVRQGAYGGGVAYQGVWGGYSQAALKSLQGKTITKVQLRVGSRLRIGSFNSPLTLHIYRSSTTGKGNPNTADGPYDESIPANASARWLTVSNSLGNALKNGGTVSIQGGSYGGVKGRSSDASSGTLKISWRK